VTGRRGFTLIELMIVVCIIGLVAGIAVPRVIRARSRAQAADAVGSMRAVRIAVTIYFDSAATWPPDGAVGAIPTGLAGYLPTNNAFQGKGWRLRWRLTNVAYGAGVRQIGTLEMTADDPAICPAVSSLFGGPSSEIAVLCGGSSGTVTQIIDR
jgi:prepilin-type N-terminal cleavage/methylation domain-containing protein